MGDPVDEGKPRAHPEHPEEPGGPAGAGEHLAVGADPHEHRLGAGEADRAADESQDGDEDEVVAGGRDAVQVVRDGDPDDHQRADEGLGGEGPLLDLEQDEQDED